jgi:hypothetical protein
MFIKVPKDIILWGKEGERRIRDQIKHPKC